MKQFDAKTLKAASPVVKELLAELWAELDTIVDHIMSTEEPEVSDFDSGICYQDIETGTAGDACKKWGEWRGQAQGIAYAIAVLSNPYKPDVEAVRAEAMQRWEAGEDE